MCASFCLKMFVLVPVFVVAVVDDDDDDDVLFLFVVVVARCCCMLLHVVVVCCCLRREGKKEGEKGQRKMEGKEERRKKEREERWRKEERAGGRLFFSISDSLWGNSCIESYHSLIYTQSPVYSQLIVGTVSHFLCLYELYGHSHCEMQPLAVIERPRL